MDKEEVLNNSLRELISNYKNTVNGKSLIEEKIIREIEQLQIAVIEILKILGEHHERIS